MTPPAFLAYGLVSGLCLLLNNAVLILGDRVGLPVAVTVPLSFLLCGLAGYLLHSRISFRQPLNLRSLLRYGFAMSGNIPLAFAGLWLWHDLARLPMALAAPLATICILSINYLLVQWAVRHPGEAR